MKLCIAYAPGGMKMLARMGRPHEYVAQIFTGRATAMLPMKF